MPRLSATMMDALGKMPVKLRSYSSVPGSPLCLPWGAPGGQTITALQRRGLISFNEREHVWVRTAGGEAVWETRPDA